MQEIYRNIRQAILWIGKLFVVLLFIFFVILYLLVKPSLETIERREAVAEVSKEEFLVEITPYAQEVSESHGVRPSILLAQAALESNWGNSELAQESNNYFGVKSSLGKTYRTKEFTQEEWAEINASFKEYESVYDSVLDYANLLKHGTSWNENLYQEVIAASTYKEAAYALSEAGYATDPNYAEKIIELIEVHQLDQFDNL